LESTISNLLFQKQPWWAVPRPTNIGYGALRTHPTQKLNSSAFICVHLRFIILGFAMAQLPKDIELESTISNLLFQKQPWWERG